MISVTRFFIHEQRCKALLVIMGISLFGGLVSTCQGTTQIAQVVDYHILVINSLRGQIFPESLENGEEKVGGISLLSSQIETLCDQYGDENAIILLNSNFVSGNAVSHFTSGSAIIEMLNKLFKKNRKGLMVLGHRDFYFLPEGVENLSKQATFPFVLANISEGDTGKLPSPFQPYYIDEKRRIAIVGIGTDQIKEKTQSIQLGNWTVLPQRVVLNNILSELKDKGIEHIFIAGDMIFPTDTTDFPTNEYEDIYQLIHPDSSGLFAVSQDINQTEQVQLSLAHPSGFKNQVYLGGTRGYTLGHYVQFHGKETPDYTLYQITSDRLQPDISLAADLHTLERNLKQVSHKPIAYALQPIEHIEEEYHYDQSPMGTLITQIAKEETEADVVLINSGFFVSGLPEGVITKKTVFNAIPYHDYFVKMPVTGEFLYQLLEQSVSVVMAKKTKSFGQVAGVRFSYDSRLEPYHRINPADIIINEKPLNRNAYYDLTVTRFTFEGNDGYSVFNEYADERNDEKMIEFAFSVYKMVSRRLENDYATGHNLNRTTTDAVFDRNPEHKPLFE